MKSNLKDVASNIFLYLSILLTGCSSTNFSKSSSSATITEQRVKLGSGAEHLGVNRLYRIAETELGPYGPRGARAEGGTIGVTYTVDAGTLEIGAWYYDNTTGSYRVNQTGIVKMIVTLMPNGRYELRSIRKSGKLRFLLFDLDSARSVAESDWSDIIVKPFPEPPATRGGMTPFSGHFHFGR